MTSKMKPEKPLVLFGVGRMADMMAFYITHYSDYEIAAFTVDREFLPDGAFHGKPVVAWDELEDHHAPHDVELLGPFSFVHINQFRRDRYLEGKARGYSYASFIHPDAMVYTETIGDHVVILENTVVQPYAEIGDNVMILSCSHLAHHSKYADHCFISSQVGVAGATEIGEQVHLSGGVQMGHGLKIGARSVILNGAWVSTDLDEETLIVGKSGAAKPYPSSRVAKRL